MANTSNVQIYRSYANTAPLTLKDGRLAYSFVSDKLFIGSNNSVITIGGRYYANTIDFSTPNTSANTLVKRDSYGGAKFNWLVVENPPSAANSVVNRDYVDTAILGSYGSIYYGTQGQPFYSNVLTTSVGVDVTANNSHIAQYRDYGIYFVPDLHVTGNTYSNYIFAKGEVDGEELHANTKILVGQASRASIPLPNSIATLSANSEYYVQINGQNLNGNGSADFVITADVGTDTDYYVDMGMGGSTYSFYTGNNSPMEPLAGYLLVQGSTLGLPGGNLVIGTTTPKTKITFMAGGYETDNIQMTMSNSGVNIWHTLTATQIVSPTLNTINSNVTASFTYTDTANTYLKGRIDSSNSYTTSYVNTANTFLQANDVITLNAAKSWTNYYTDTANSFLQANDASTLSIAKAYTDIANTFNQANTGTAIIQANNWLQANDSATLVVAETYTDTANTNLRLYVDGKVSANLVTAETYTDTANTNLRLYIDNKISSNLVTAETYTDTANTNLRLYVDGKVTANNNSANSYLVSYINTNITANLVTAETYTDTANTNLRLYVDGKVSANLVTAETYTDTANNKLKSYTDYNITANLTTAKAYTDTANSYNTNLTNGNLTTALNYTNTANTFLQANDASTLAVARAYTDTANGWLQGNIFNTLTTSKAYTDTANTFNQANTGAGLIGANSYTDTANTNLRLYVDGKVSANLLLAYANTGTANIIAVSASSYANGAFVSANSGGVYANAAFAQANTGNVTANAAFAFANTSNAYFYGVDNTQNTNILIVGIYANGAYSSQNTTGVYANAAFLAQNTTGVYANSAYLSQNTTGVYANTALQYANSASSYANSAYATANLKLNSSGGDIAFINVASNVSIGTSIDFDITKPESTQKEGRIWYDKYSKALAYYNDTPGYIHLGMDRVVRVWNNTGSTIPAAKAVYINGSSSANGIPSIALANAATQTTAEVIGVTQRDIPTGTYGLAVSAGLIEYQDTSLLTSGQNLYLSDTVPGNLTTSVPPAPSIPLQIGYVASVSPTYGEYIVDMHLMEGVNKTTGAVLFARNGAIDQDPNDLYWDYANNRLGIGTNNPTANLHVIGSGLFTGNVTISGNLLISNAQSITTTQLTVGGNTIILNANTTGVPTSNADIIINRGSSTNSYIRWSETDVEWFIYEGTGTAGHILSSEKTFQTWTTYTSAAAYDKLKYPIGADLANSINEHAKSSYATANLAYYNAQSGYIQANSAYLSQNTTGVYSNTALQYANSAGSYANSAYIKANTFDQFATTGTYTTSSTSQVAVDNWNNTIYRSATYQLQLTSGTSYHVLDLKLLHDGTNVWWNGYGELWNVSKLATFSANISGSNVQLLITPVNSTTTIKFVRSLITV